MKNGLEIVLSSQEMQKKWRGARIGVLCHPASVNEDLEHCLDLLVNKSDLDITCAFGPQHGVRGEKQDNMIESQDFIDPRYSIPVYSLYGAFRRPQEDMLNNLDLLVVDLQDVGCRIYTYLTTLFYTMEECSRLNKKVVVFDRPNPAGRPIEGSILNMEFASFVGAAPLPMRHGLTLGEAANWYREHKNLDLDLEVVEMEAYNINESPWPTNRSWINPSPNIPRFSCTQVYCGTVLLEGTLTSEGRGTTLPLEMFGAPGFDGEQIINEMKALNSDWLKHCLLRPCFFEPTFHKHQGELCGGLQIHVDHPTYGANSLQVYRLIALYLKSIGRLYPAFELWRSPPYEYEEKHMPIDILSGDSRLRNWVDSDSARVQDLDQYLVKDEQAWAKQSIEFKIY